MDVTRVVLPWAAADSLAGAAARSGAELGAAGRGGSAQVMARPPGRATNLPTHTTGEFSLATSSSIPGNSHLAGARAPARGPAKLQLRIRVHVLLHLQVVEQARGRIRI